MKKILVVGLLAVNLLNAGKIELSGSVFSDNQKMLTSRYMGFIKSVNVSEGDRVKKGELLTEIIIPKFSKTKLARKKITRAHDDLPAFQLAVSIRTSRQTVNFIKIAFVSNKPLPIELKKTGEFLLGKIPDDSLIDQAAEIAESEVAVLFDHSIDFGDDGSNCIRFANELSGIYFGAVSDTNPAFYKNGQLFAKTSVKSKAVYSNKIEVYSTINDFSDSSLDFSSRPKL